MRKPQNLRASRCQFIQCVAHQFHVPRLFPQVAMQGVTVRAVGQPLCATIVNCQMWECHQRLQRAVAVIHTYSWSNYVFLLEEPSAREPNEGKACVAGQERADATGPDASRHVTVLCKLGPGRVARTSRSLHLPQRAVRDSRTKSWPASFLMY